LPYQSVGVPHPEQFAALAIFIIGGLNYFVPKHTGGLAFLIAVPTVILVRFDPVVCSAALNCEAAFEVAVGVPRQAVVSSPARDFRR
jgi:hypothetical protein